MIKLLGTLKKVAVKSKETTQGDVIHSVDLSFELIQGVDRTVELIDQIKKIQEVTIDSRQPKLPITDGETRKLAREK